MSSTAMLDGFSDHVRDIVLLIDPETGRIIEANPAAEYMYGYSREELLGLSIFDLRVAPPASVNQQMQLADRTGVLFEGMHRRSDGTEFPVEVSSRGETLDGKRVLLSVVRDITERKKHDAEREELLASAQRALESREEFLWVASHELRTPIAIVSLQLQQLRRLIERGEPTERLASATAAALSQVGRMNTLVQSLFDVSQIEHGRFTIARAEADLAVIVHDVVERLAAQAALVGSKLVVEVPELRGRWDRMRLEQVFTNVIGNAIKYGAGRPVEVAAHDAGDMVHAEVRDSGIGIGEADTERIFGKFQRAVPAAHYGGLGLGLYISKQIVEAHGGSIAVQSTPGAGATFRIALPR
jgi:PAS domain S-box-containing protein